MLDAKAIKEIAKNLGADIVGIASMDRFENAPPELDPRFIMPRAKSLIAMGFRVMRGSLRGIEEGTHFANYSAMGYGGLTYLYMPMTVINICKVIEDEGYEAMPMGHQSDWRSSTGHEGGIVKTKYSRPVAPGKPAPDVAVHLRLAAYAAGLGEIGYSKMFLSPEFGPRQRIGVIITELELEPDPIYDGQKLCNKCMACVRECPGNCISGTEVVKTNVGGHEVEWGKIDTHRCDIYFRGAVPCEEGEIGNYTNDGNFKPGPKSPFYKKPNNLYNSGQAICGAAGCTRACMISLEARGVIKNQFKSKFRTEKPWSIDWSDYMAELKEKNKTEFKEAD